MGCPGDGRLALALVLTPMAISAAAITIVVAAGLMSAALSHVSHAVIDPSGFGRSATPFCSCA